MFDLKKLLNKIKVMHINYICLFDSQMQILYIIKRTSYFNYISCFGMPLPRKLGWRGCEGSKDCLLVNFCIF